MSTPDPKTTEQATVTTATIIEFPEVLTLEELCALLRLHRNTVSQMIAGGTIPGVRRIGQVYRIHRDTVLQWLADGDATPTRSAGRGRRRSQGVQR